MSAPSSAATGGFTWDRLQQLLSEDAERRQQKQAKEREHRRRHQKQLKSIREYWTRIGVLPPPDDDEDADVVTTQRRWVRPLAPNLYQCPLSQPQTTLVPWKTLPRYVQKKVLERQGRTWSEDQGGPGVAEVPLSWLTAAAAAEQQERGGGGGGLVASTITATARPVRGNLTTKLAEYTRGMSGQTRPFRPGGLGTAAEGEGGDTAELVCDEARTEQAVERSRAVLRDGSEASWKNGNLLTAPPGVAFQVGISWQDVRGASVETDGQASHQEPSSQIAVEPELEETPASLLTPPQTVSVYSAPARQTMFSRSFFDDDSLFGSSSSSSSSSTDEEEDADEVAAEGSEEQEDTLVKKVTEMAFVDDTVATEEVTADEGDIDELLAQLTVSDDGTFRKKKPTVQTNPLKMAERQSQDQNNATRKQWANTKLLPIRDFAALIPNPALKFPFPLDDFQQQAVARLERSESVFVAAHTSAGKTVVAEYAVALAKQRATRCVYTSPIKALSNQKFRDFSLKFGSENVGLVTGDLQVNVDDSTCLIMTTEILRSMLYRGADLIRDIEWVIFDEVHYVNDTERGVVWEEVIIMLPSYVNLIFLSATTPNTLEFSDWIGRTKRKPVHVVKTNYRPVPLSHFLWAGTKLHKVLEGNGPFLEKGYKEAADALLPQSAKDPTKKKSEQKGRPATGGKQLAWQALGTKQNWNSLVRFLDREFLTPAVVFSFSKRKCEEIAYMLRSMDLNTAKERSAVQSFALQTVARLSENDAKLPQVLTICEMVQRGIGVHHGGLLPILKEMVEILFSRNLIKVLFATETFAMGVNMPAKAVVFNSIRKHDGTQFRVLEPGEYTQMAGRAGRRGLDKVGTVILCCFGEQPPPQPILRQMLTGTSTRLQSQFRLTYNMILNLLKVEEMSVEAMIKRSFSEFATQRALTANEYPQLLSKGVRTLEKLEEQFRNDAANRVGAEDLEEYFSVCCELFGVHQEVLSYIRETDIATFEELFQQGRVILVSAARQYGIVRAPAVILRPPTPTSLVQEKPSGLNSEGLVCMVLMPASYVPEKGTAEKKLGEIDYIGSALQRHYAIREFSLDQILMIAGGKRRKIDTKSLLKEEGNSKEHPGHAGMQDFFPSPASRDPFAGMKALGKKGDDGTKNLRSGSADGGEVDKVTGYLLEVERMELREAGMATIDLKSMVTRGSDVVQVRQACDQVHQLILQMRSFRSHCHPSLEKYYTDIERKYILRTKVETLRHLLSNESLQLFPDFLQRKAVLRKLGYIDENETVSVKGRVACEVNTCEELIATELVFEGLLNDLEPEEIAAVLSALVYHQKSKDEEFDSELPEKLVTCCEQMKTIGRNLGQLQKEQGLDVDPLEYCDNSLKFGLVHVVYEWALGVPFKNVCDLTDAEEGSIVRCITRLDELCRDIRNCARVVGNPTLYRKLEAASTAIKRDIVFASSLYV